jgi:D-isomer specific 2-hydroxyacid dehydrogenase, NAD binding domain
MSSDPLVVLVNVDAPASVLTRVRDIASRITVVTAAELAERPAWLAEANVLYTHLNIGRGATVQTDALLEALKSGRIAGAALDVTDPEPLPPDHALWAMDNVILTPHYAGFHPGYIQRASAIFLENLARYVAGESLTNVVDKHAGY